MKDSQLSGSVKLLLVEDNPAEARLLLEMLRSADAGSRFEVEVASNLQEGILRAQDSELMLLDLSLPDANGFATFHRARRSVDIPIVVVSGLDDEDLALQAVVDGAQDYLVKGQFDGDGLVRSIRYAIERHRLTVQHQRAEQALRDSEERYRRFFEEDLTGDCIIDAEGRILASNPAFAHIFGFASPAQASAADLGYLFPEPLARHEFLARVRREGKIERFECQGRRRDGRSVYLIGNAVGRFDETSNELVELSVYLFDDTERKQTELQFLQAQKMEAVGRLAGGVAHDFSNILTAITFHAEYLLTKLKKDDPLHERAADIKRASKRAASLTSQLLAFSRRQVLRPKILDLNQVVSDVKSLFQRVIGEDIELVDQLAADLGKIRADPSQLEQVILNLVVNARDAMPDGGRLTLETRNVEVVEEQAETLGSLSPGTYVTFSVSDTGHGMSSEIQSNIFEPFFTTKERGKGTGLGLSTVYGIIKQSNGHISVTSEVDRGTTFRIYLPRVEDTVQRTRHRETADAQLQGSETILVVEDDDALRGLMLEALHMQGYHVLEARSGAVALATCSRHTAPIDLLITDVVMPDVRGSELVARIREQRPQTRILFMSGYIDDSTVRQDVGNARVPFMEKPFSSLDLTRRVREILDGNSRPWG